MQPQNVVLNCYDKTAKAYADKFSGELQHKHFDRMLLKAFADENKDKGPMIDFGCGPGQTTKFLFDCGVTNIIGTDLSPAMIAAAKELHPSLSFETADMLALNYADASFGSAVAFYSIVHSTYEQLAIAFKEIRRVLKNDGQFLFSFHIGNETVHLDSFLEEDVSIDFYFFETEKVLEILGQAGFEVIDAAERYPYKEVEHPTKRAYVWVKK